MATDSRRLAADGPGGPLFGDDHHRRGISDAVRQEIAASGRGTVTVELEIDGIEHVSSLGGRYLYRLSLSEIIRVVPDQPLRFRTRSGETVTAVVVEVQDAALTVACDQPLPTDARLSRVTFEPTFILRALESFVFERARTPGPIARQVWAAELPELPDVNPVSISGLNEDQCRAVAEMSKASVYLLWGPPGTGKTTTLGAAIAAWMRAGKRVLVTSTSNAAVDVALGAVLRVTTPAERSRLYRMGTSTDPEVQPLTDAGRLGKHAEWAGVNRDQDRLRVIRERVSSPLCTAAERDRLFAEARPIETRLERFQRSAAEAAPRFEADARVTGCTLATMVLAPGLRTRTFDVVVLDEASMASSLFAVAASLLADSNLVYAGDHKQLPPIVQSDQTEAVRWFGRNIYDRFQVGTRPDPDPRLRLLRTQYRMTNEIGGLVGALSYSGRLLHGRNASGPRVTFVDVGPEWATNHFAVENRSYFHLASVPLVHALADCYRLRSVCLLAPFRPQRSLLSAVGFDIAARIPGFSATASTIHRSQGSEAAEVVVDLTTHAPDRPVQFFRDAHGSRLLNVALSRARDRLIVIGSLRLVERLADADPFWMGFFVDIGTGIEHRSAAEVLAGARRFPSPNDAGGGADASPSVVFSCRPGTPGYRQGLRRLTHSRAGRKLLVQPDSADMPDGVIVRHSPDRPDVYAGDGVILLPFEKQWLRVEAENAARVVWRVGFAHLADDEVNPNQVRRFWCPKCTTGELRVSKVAGGGWYLACSNRQEQCFHTRRVTEQDAGVLARLGGHRCDHDHPLTGRTGPSGGVFLGCENFPDCKYQRSLDLLYGV